MATKLDQELAEEVAQAEEAPSSIPALVAPPSPARRGSRVLLITLLAMVGGSLTLVFVGMGKGAVYALDVDQLRASAATSVGKRVRVQGKLVPGSLEKRDSPCEYRFTIEGAEGRLPVTYAQCVVPDSFVDRKEGNVEATVEGSLQPDGTFVATQVMAKCVSKDGYKEYDPKTHQMKPRAQRD